MKRVLLVYAHADDELLWGHPWLLNRSLDRRVLICCSDKNNPARQSYRRGEEALAAVCADVGITEYRVLDQYWSEFYRLRTRGPGDGPLLKDWWDNAQMAVRKLMRECDAIATHNPIGEYGHLDHILVRRMVSEMTDRKRMLWTDARVETSTWPVGQERVSIHERQDAEQCRQNAGLFNQLKDHYESRDCWTWSRDEPLNVLKIREQ